MSLATPKPIVISACEHPKDTIIICLRCDGRERREDETAAKIAAWLVRTDYAHCWGIELTAQAVVRGDWRT